MAHWFRRKHIGYGISPASMEGWLLTVVLIGAIVVLARYFMVGPDRNPAIFWGGSVASIIVYLAIALLTLSPKQ